MTEHYHVMIWIDHQQARILQFNATEFDSAVVHSSHAHRHLHHKANVAAGSGHEPVDTEFMKRVAGAVAHAGALLVTGPAGAKKELVHYLEHSHPALARKVSGVEPLDHLSDGALLAFGRHFFRADDRMH